MAGENKMAMIVEMREQSSSQGYVMLVRIGRQEFIEHVTQKDLARQVSEKLADKIALSMWERIEPKILEALTQGFRAIE